MHQEQAGPDQDLPLCGAGLRYQVVTPTGQGLISICSDLGQVLPQDLPQVGAGPDEDLPVPGAAPEAGTASGRVRS